MGRDVPLQKGFKMDGKTITPMAIMHYFWAIWEQSDSYFKKTIEPDWDLNDALYRDKFSVPRKMGWQSEVQIPIVDQLVTRITQFFVRVLVNTYENFFDVKHPNKQKQQAYTAILKAVLRDNRFAEEVFPSALANAWLNALFITKTYWCSETETYPLWDTEENRLIYQEEVRSKVRIDVVNPRNIRLDPYGEQYIIEICKAVPMHTFLEMGRENGWINLDYIKKEMLISQPASDEEDVDKNTDTSNHLPTVDIAYVYTKALTDEQGKLLCKDVCFVIVNDKYVVDFKYNTGINGATPYTVHNPMLDVHGRYGRPYISKLRSLIKQYINIVNLANDAGVLTGLGTHEIDKSLIDPSQAHSLSSDIEPGKQIIKNGQGDLLKSTYPNSGIMQGLLQLIYYYDQQIQNHSYQTEFFDGQNTSRGRKTATEVQTKTQQSNTFFTDIATQIENYSVQPTVEKALFTYLLHMDDTTIKDLSKHISDDNVKGYFLGLDYAERLADIRDLQIEVKGISGRLQTQNNFSKIVQLLGVLTQFGIMPNAVDKLIDKAFTVVDDTPDELFDMEQIRAQLEMTRQAQATPSQAPPSGPPGQSAQGMAQPPQAQVQKEMAEQTPPPGV